MVFNDVDKFDEQNNYDFYFLATEDYLIRDKFKNKYNEKLKHLETNLSFNYNYSRNEYGVLLEKDKITQLIKPTNMYYDSIMGKIYLSKEYYYDEI